MPTRLAFPARTLHFGSGPYEDENRLSITFSQHCRAQEFTLTDSQVVLLWEQLGERVALLARRPTHACSLDTASQLSDPAPGRRDRSRG